MLALNCRNYYQMQNMLHYSKIQSKLSLGKIQYYENLARRAGSDGNMSASGSAGPGFNPRRGSKF